MENAKQGINADCIKAFLGSVTTKDLLNTIVMFIAFVGYALTFLIPKFYGMTENYVGVFVFVVLVILFFINVNPIECIKNKDFDFIVLAVLAIVAGVNLIIVDSGYGCFFVVFNFALIFYLAGRMNFKKWQIYFFSGLYLLLLCVWYFWAYPWMFADYTAYAYNTNTAATFTIFTTLCAFVLCELLIDSHPLTGLLMVILLLKAFQIGLYHRARGSFIMLLVFILFRFVIPKKWWAKKGFFRSVCVFVTLGSLLFVAIYVVVGMSGANFKLPFFYKEVFSGREAIWLEFWNLFKAKPLTGIGTNVTIESFFEFNVHNAMYNILVIHGLVVFVGVLILMYRRFFEVGERIRLSSFSLGKVKSSKASINSTALSGVSYAAILAILAVCLESFFDVDLIWTDYSLNVLFLMLVAMFKDNAR